jgi:hypothetical protein
VDVAVEQRPAIVIRPSGCAVIALKRAIMSITT